MKEKSSSGKRSNASNSKESSHHRVIKEKETQRHDRHSKSTPTTLLHVPLEKLTEQDKVNLIAELSEAILEDPTTAFTSESSVAKDVMTLLPSKFQRLFEIAQQSSLFHTAGDPNDTSALNNTSRLAILSLMAVFQDIVPSYRIRPPTEAELAVKVTKETKKLWDYERTLLTQYQLYLKFLEKLIPLSTRSSSSSSSSSLAITAILCLCELLTSLPHFNFRSNILSIIVKHMNHKSCTEIQVACCQAITTLFITDKQGEISLEATRLICNQIKDHPLKIHPSVIQTFLSLPLRIHDDEVQAAKMMEKVQAKKRKRDIELAQVEKDLKEGDATVDTILLAKCHGDILQRITLTYFRILKSFVQQYQQQQQQQEIERTMNYQQETSRSMYHHSNSKKGHPLLSVALEGLARFTHLIHFDAVTDLLHVLKSVVQQDESLGVETSLHCIFTALQTLQGPGKELPVDPKEYLLPLYRQLQGLIPETNAKKHTTLALKCLYASFIKRKDFSSVRVSSFVKRLCMVSLHAPSYTSASLLAFSRQVLHKYPSVSQLFENDQELVSAVPIASDIEDPDHVNVSHATAWELSILRFHVNPLVSSHADGLANQRVLQLPLEDPLRIFTQTSKYCDDCIIPYKARVKKHPLSSRTMDASKKKRQQIRFITPRKTKEYHLQPLVFY